MVNAEHSVPDNYTYGVADIHRYNMLGDGWTIDIVSHIFKYITIHLTN